MDRVAARAGGYYPPALAMRQLVLRAFGLLSACKSKMAWWRVQEASSESRFLEYALNVAPSWHLEQTETPDQWLVDLVSPLGGVVCTLGVIKDAEFAADEFLSHMLRRFEARDPSATSIETAVGKFEGSRFEATLGEDHGTGEVLSVHAANGWLTITLFQRGNSTLRDACVRQLATVRHVGVSPG